MAKGLFATENDDLETGVAGELDVAPEVGAVAEIEAEATADVADITEDAVAIDDGATAGEQLEEVQDVLTEAVDSGEGLTPVAAESIRMAIAAICKPIHADPKRVYSLYARESFAAESSRLANTQFALEGVKEFLTDLYKRIKAALERMWNKVKAFWDKHISAVGQMKKAIESMKKKLKDAKKLKGSPVVESIPSSLARAFDTTDQLKSSDVLATLDSAVKFRENVSAMLTSATKEAAAEISAAVAAVGGEPAVEAKPIILELKESSGLVNGVKIAVSTEVEDNDTQSFDIDRTDSEKDIDGSKGLVVAKVTDLEGILNKAGEAIKSAIETKKNYERDTELLNKALQAHATRLQAMPTGDDIKDAAAKVVQKALMKLSKFSSFHAKLATTASVENVKAARFALAYVNFNLKYYTK